MDNYNYTKKRIPLIERITICGVRINDIHSFLSNPKNKIENIKSLKIKILEDYKSNLIPDSDEYNMYKSNIPNVTTKINIKNDFYLKLCV